MEHIVLALRLLGERLIETRVLAEISPPLFPQEDPGNALRSAGAQGNLGQIIELLNRNSALVDSMTSSQRRTALHWAMDKEHFQPS